MSLTIAPKIDRPCRLRWESLQGDDKKRFCERCQLHVHNLSAMTAEEQLALSNSNTSRFCVRYQTHENLRTVSWGVWTGISRLLTLRNATIALVLGCLGLFGVKARETMSSPPPSHVSMDSTSIMGFSCPAPPLPWWKRLIKRFFP